MQFFCKKFYILWPQMKNSLSLVMFTLLGEIRDVIKKHCNCEDFILAVIRSDGRDHWCLSVWLFPHLYLCKHIKYLASNKWCRSHISHLRGKCIIEMPIILSKVNNLWCFSVDSGAFLFPANIRYILFPPKIHFWHGFVFPMYSVFRTTFLPMFPLT